MTPNHRALADAQATVDVLHGLMERVGNLGVHTLTELQGYSNRVPDARRRKRGLADGLPDGPGVYVFEDSQGAALYVGTSRSIRRRVLSYFTAAEQRRRMTEMVGLATKVVAVPCATPLEAQVRELRTIAARAPRYNRRSTRPQNAVWLKLTVERFPRVSVVSKVRDDVERGARYIGPFTSRRTAEAAAEALAEALPLRTCSQSLSSRPKASACVLADLGRCPAPCVGAVTPEEYAAIVERAQRGAGQRPSRGRGGPHRPHGRPGRAGALRGGRRVARPPQRPAARRRHRHHQRRPGPDPPDRRRPAHRRPRAGRSTSSATAGWPRRG